MPSNAEVFNRGGPRLSRFEFDANGQLIKFIDAAGRERTYSYDVRGQISQVNYPDGTTVKQTYDNAGRILTSEDQGGKLSRYGYDAVGNLLLVGLTGNIASGKSTVAHLLSERGATSVAARWLAKRLPVAKELHGNRFFVRHGGKLLVTPLLVAVIALELTDIMFAIDSVPAVLAGDSAARRWSSPSLSAAATTCTSSRTPVRWSTAAAMARPRAARAAARRWPDRRLDAGPNPTYT